VPQARGNVVVCLLGLEQGCEEHNAGSAAAAKRVEARIKPTRLVKVRDGAVDVILGLMCKGAVVKGKRIFRIDPDRLAEVRDRAVSVTLGAIL
jgi:hypothetical protein